MPDDVKNQVNWEAEKWDAWEMYCGLCLAVRSVD